MRRHAAGRQWRVLALSAASTVGWLEHGGQRWRCALGRSGVRAIKREGDGATPLGVWPVRRLVYRADRVPRPATRLPIDRVRPSDGWCDAVGDRSYNRPVRRPYPASHEEMWRSDGLYDVVVVLGCNDVPRRQGCGSAIFMHVARTGYAPTAGCIALSPRDLRQVATLLARHSRVHVGR
jgi:L,D-peptidoglycan transpeptidase YkuD (ErfK/YbiS/YcfS/YnhG family)